MPLEIMFGINASGKDSVFRELKNRDNKIESTSESRLLMYHLGYVDSYSLEQPVSRDVYKQLENTPQERIIKITNSSYRETLEKFRDSEIEYFLLSHLVTALTIDKNPIYLEKDVPFWYRDTGSKFIQIVCDPEEILRRRLKDKNGGTRDRGNLDTLCEIENHQALCDEKWRKLTTDLPNYRFTTIPNTDLFITVNNIEKFLQRKI